MTQEHLVPGEKQIQDMIREIFSGVLGKRDFGDADEFVDLGGTSLGLIAVVARICGRLEIDTEVDIAARGTSVLALSRVVGELIGA